jgi:hypothetical protein
VEYHNFSDSGTIWQRGRASMTQTWKNLEQNFALMKREKVRDFLVLTEATVFQATGVMVQWRKV